MRPVPASPISSSYTGRFAPSPTGPLHFGSLLAATASYLEARRQGGRWLIRIEDIDPPREQPGADEGIIATLAAYGFEWDGPVIYQSRRRDRHEAIIRELQDRGLAYRCGCTRRELAGCTRGPLGAIYPGTCRRGSRARQAAIRLLTTDEPVEFMDRLQGAQCQHLLSESGDFVIRRRDSLIAYQLAVAVDDADDEITEIVRGIDLLSSTPRQVYLLDLLGYSRPGFAHIPVVENSEGQKLSKTTGARPIAVDKPGATLVTALRALQQRPEPGLESASLRDIWTWAMQNWSLDAMVGRRNIALQHYCSD